MITFGVAARKRGEKDNFELPFFVGSGREGVGRIMFFTGGGCSSDYDDHCIEVFGGGCRLEVSDMEAILQKVIEMNHLWRTMVDCYLEQGEELAGILTKVSDEGGS